MSMMKRGPVIDSRYVLWLGLLLVAIAVLLARNGFKKWSGKGVQSVGDNPQDFFVCARSSAVGAYFRYDPRAADEWLFHSGARLMLTSRPTAE